MFGIGPVPAVALALDRARWTLRDVERVEINESFAAVPLAVLRQLGLPEDIDSMRRDSLKRGIVRLCISGGQGIALALEML